jgi:hypothetical protein
MKHCSGIRAIGKVCARSAMIERLQSKMEGLGERMLFILMKTDNDNH